MQVSSVALAGGLPRNALASTAMSDRRGIFSCSRKVRITCFAIIVFSFAWRNLKLLFSGDGDQHSLAAEKQMSIGPIVADIRVQGEEDSTAALDIDRICPRSSVINKMNNNTPPSKLMRIGEVLSIIKYWHEINCPQKETCNFSSIGQHLLHIAMKRNQTLLTVHVGAMDGHSNDPLHQMFVKTRGKNYVQARLKDIPPGRDSSFPDLRNWLPVMIEPVPKNYEDLVQTYSKVANDTGLGCSVPIHGAVSYDSNKTTCPFCRVNTADDAPSRCKELPDWMKLQIGTLDCEHSKNFFNKDFDLCVLQDPLPCNSLVNLLTDNFVPVEHTAMLQIDIEGYEYILFEGMFKEMSYESLPPIIHFEHKVMIDQDRKHPLVNTSSPTGKLSRMNFTKALLSSRGYHFYDEGEDYLALKLD